MKKIALLITSSLVFLSACVFASTKYYSTNELIQLAGQGDAKAQFELSNRYWIGSGVERDLSKRMKLLKQAASGEHIEAMYIYGTMVENPIEGLKYIKMAANSNFVQAELFLGEHFLTTNSSYVDYDINKAISWLEKASSNSGKYAGVAAYRLHLLYIRDRYSANIEIAEQWLAKALSKHVPKSDYELISEISYGEDNIQNLFFMIFAAKKGLVDAQREYGKDYLYGVNYYKDNKDLRPFQAKLEKDGKKAKKWLSLAASKGDANALYSLGFMYKHGVYHIENKKAVWHIKPDHISSATSYRKAAQGGLSEAQEIVDSFGTKTVEGWNKKYSPNSALTHHISNIYEDTYFRAKVGYLSDNKKHIYFKIYGTKVDCDKGEFSTWDNDSVWQFNNQGVLMTIMCDINADGDGSIFTYPASKKGEQFVINLFQRESNNISIEREGFDFKMSPKGFTKVWGNSSGDVL
ncbi:sel1 repeat family protein [Colwellia sp. MB02u-10]|uniref:tetratricopeptide repeat protein n=1 Tax=Colwellia sp. MB02u-10 TaxID=2759828 RepID=UPI0015F40CE3|nr:tetratricopeptide repeat protein [Colwellia sp. MB02u-10]MBA6340025.1 sel1 repeat family protein [Colwellia sp. MB02u-10]